MHTHIILASRSPRRIELLKQIGVECTVLPADIDESVQQGEAPADYVKRLAKQKAEAILKLRKPEFANMLVLAADTTVALAHEILGKPENDDDALNMLKKLSGKAHQVHTAVTICGYNHTVSALNTTQVVFSNVSVAKIKAYIATGEHRDKAGSYGIQGIAGAWIKRIEGSYSGVMGLPLYETAQLLNEMKDKIATRNTN